MGKKINNHVFSFFDNDFLIFWLMLPLQGIVSEVHF